MRARREGSCAPAQQADAADEARRSCRSARFARGASCSAREATTEDHVVAEGFFDVAPPEGYIKVPSCYPCNNSYSRDEEYFLVAMLAEGTIRSVTANRVLDRLSDDHRTGRRKRTGLALALLERIRPVEVESPGGIYLGSAQAVELDVPRVNRVLEKLVRGLFFHRVGKPLPPEARVSVEIKPSLERLRLPITAMAMSQAPSFLGDVFMYRVFILPGTTDSSSWVLGFYDAAILAVGFTAPPGSS